LESGIFIEAEKLRYAYSEKSRQRVLNGIDLKINADEYLLICGASGSGKSTLCRTFNGLIPHFYGGLLEGDIRVAGLNTAEQTVGELFSSVGMIFQNPETQLFNRTVKHEIAFGLESLGLPREEIKKRIAECSGILKIEHLLSRNPHELSGGEQHIVSIAAVLASGPQIIILDEPFANLDPVNANLVRSVLKKIHGRGTGVIVIEHRLVLTVPDVQRIVVLKDGAIVLDGPPEEVLAGDLESFGLNPPFTVKAGREAGLKHVALDMAALQSALSDRPIPRCLPSRKSESVRFDNSEPALLEVNGLSHEIDNTSVLKNVSLTLRKGECTAVVGANGAGKTTLLKHLIGLLRPSEGSISIMGNDIRGCRVSQLASLVGIAFQNPNNQFFKLKVSDEISIGARTLGCYNHSWIEELVSTFALEGFMDRAPYRLSGGEKKRVAFAAALAAKPAILALDEPTAGQDHDFRIALGNLLAKLREQGQAVLLVTHDLTFAEQHAGRWLLMAKGEAIAEGTPYEVMENESAMASANLLPTDLFTFMKFSETREEHRPMDMK